MSRALPSILAVIAAATLTFAGSAQAAGGNYVFDGGTQAEQQQVRAGLNASSFDWSLVPAQITIHIGRGISTSYALPGQIWLDANLLDSGRFAWGTVQMEYAHQVHFLLLNDHQRAALTTALGAKAWCWERTGLAHPDNGCERFSATLESHPRAAYHARRNRQGGAPPKSGRADLPRAAALSLGPLGPSARAERTRERRSALLQSACHM